MTNDDDGLSYGKHLRSIGQQGVILRDYYSSAEQEFHPRPTFVLHSAEKALIIANLSPMDSLNRSPRIQTMQAPLLSFLTEFERALVAAEPSPDSGGAWAVARSVNYGQGVARMTLAVRKAGQESPKGHVTLQGYRLADGTFCLKAHLHWEGHPQVRTRAIYSKPSLDWDQEAQRLAQDWLTGPTATAASSAQA